jgi:hypothetical protein
MTAAEIAELRQRFWQRGYRPLEVWNPDQRVNDNGEPLNSPGKQPRGRWREDANHDPPEAVRTKPDPRALNTGLLCGDIIGFDVDVLDQGLVDQIVNLIERRAGRTPLKRIGRAPKILLVYRPHQRFAKIQTPELIFPGGSKAKLELLADGQQFVAAGIHPDTGAPFRWLDESPADVPIEELPIISEDEARAIVELAEQILRAAGAKEKEKPQREPPKTNGAAGNFFAKVNAAALADIRAWAPLLFPRARREPGTGAWRISSKALNRNLEEDISIHPDGIRDFGEEVPLSAIDLVIRHGGAATAVDAALWLCMRLAIDPTSLGFRKKQQQKANGVDTEPPEDFQQNAPLPRPATPAARPPAFRDPWADPEGATWPPNTLPPHVNDMIFVTSMATGADPGAQALATIAAVSGAAPKNARFAPYGPDEIWRVPPIVWVMIVAPSGFRKTALDPPFSALKQKDDGRWGQFTDELKNWRSLSQEEQKKTRKPPEPHAFIVTDTTVERVQITLADTDRGTLYKRDELAGFLGCFGRYNQDKGFAERSFYLESFEGGPYNVLRIGRDSIHIHVNGLTVYGCIQPDRLKQFADLEDDGLLQRFIAYRARSAVLSRPVGSIPGKTEFDNTIAKLADMPGRPYRPYRSTKESTDIIRKLEADALDYASLTDLGPGFSGFCAKLHGTLARLALILHMLKHPDPDVTMIDPNTVSQADRIVRGFILPSAVDFYHGVSEKRVERTRSIASWLLTSAPDVIRASDFGKYVRACRDLSAAELNAALEPLITGDWLDPETPWPSNRAWHLNRAVRSVFAARAEEVKTRGELSRQLWARVAEQRSKEE